MASRRRFRRSVAVSLLLSLLASAAPAPSPPDRCRLVHSLRAEIAGYRPVVDRVLSYVRDGAGYKGRTWNALAAFADTFGSRLAGTPNLETSIDYVTNALRAAGLDNVHTERVEFTGWQRYARARARFPASCPLYGVWLVNNETIRLAITRVQIRELNRLCL